MMRITPLPPTTPVTDPRTGELRVSRLRLHGVSGRLGIDVAPRVSWELLAPAGTPSTPERSHVRLLRDDVVVWTSSVTGHPAVVECPREVLSSDTEYRVEVEVSIDALTARAATEFRTGLLSPDDWSPSAWIGAPAALVGPAPVFRGEFEVPDDAGSARLYLAAGGTVRVLVNGALLEQDHLGPGITDYGKRVQYVCVDVSDLVHAGRNAITIEVGRGFFAISEPTVWRWERSAWRDEPCVRAMIVAGDAGEVVCATGPSFRVTTGGTRYDDVYGGETFDEREEPHGAAVVGFDDRAWPAADVVTGAAGVLVHRRQPPIRVTERIVPQRVATDDERVVFDVGRVVAGWAALRVRGETGTRITVRYGERLGDEGPNDDDPRGHYNGRLQRDEITLAGGDAVLGWESRFTWKGFRYVEVTGWPGDGPEPGDVTACVAHTDLEVTGSFSCADETIDDIHRLVVPTVLNNMHSIPTDTPAFEKNGWTLDGMLATPLALTNLDAVELLTKWVDDISDARDASGAPYVLAPHGGWDWDWSPAPPWHAAYVLVPWWLFQHTGDDRVLRDHVDGILAYVELEYSRSPGGIAWTTLGDWVSPDSSPEGGNPPEDYRVSATAYLHEMLVTVAAICDALGRGDGDGLRAKAALVRRAFLTEFYDHDRGIVHGEGDEGYRQSHNTLALAFDLVPDEDHVRVADALVADIRARGMHLNTGVLSTAHLLPVLTRSGHVDVALALARQRTYPSWGHWLERGATTLWEHWHEDSRSLNHMFLGTVDEWFYSVVAGVERADVAWRTIRFEPRVLGAVQSAHASVRTPLGPATISWNAYGDEATVRIDVPYGARGIVILPAGALAADGSGPASADADSSRFEVEHGHHAFDCPALPR